MMEIVNIEEENLHIFWITWGNSLKSSRKAWLMIILKLTKKQGFILSLENTIFEKLQWVSLFRVKLTLTCCRPFQAMLSLDYFHLYAVILLMIYLWSRTAVFLNSWEARHKRLLQNWLQIRKKNPNENLDWSLIKNSFNLFALWKNRTLSFDVKSSF